MSSSPLGSLIVNANRLSQRLKGREADADRIQAGVEEVNNQLETMRQVSLNATHSSGKSGFSFESSIFEIDFWFSLIYDFVFFFRDSLKTIWIC